MTGWASVVLNSLWIIGFAIVFAAFGYHDWLASVTRRPRRDVFRLPSWRIAFAGGGLLVAVGFGLAPGVAWWERAGWTLLALWLVIDGIRAVRAT